MLMREDQVLDSVEPGLRFNCVWWMEPCAIVEYLHTDGSKIQTTVCEGLLNRSREFGTLKHSNTHTRTFV